MRKAIAVLITSLLSSTGWGENTEWSESPSDEHAYTIFYRDRYVDDLPLVHRWIDHAFELSEKDYGLVLRPLDVYLPAIGETFRGHEVKLGFGWYSNRGYHGGQPIETPFVAHSAPGSVVEYCAEREPNCGGSRTAIGQRPDSEAAIVKVLVHEVFHHVQVEVRQRIRAANNYDGLRFSQFPKWFTEGGAELTGWADNPARDEMFELLLDTVDQRYRGTYGCCWNLGSSPVISIQDAYRGGWLFLAFVEEYCGGGFYPNILTTEEETFEDAWASELESCDVAMPSLFREFQGWFDVHRPSEDDMAWIPDTRDRDDAERLRRLVRLLTDILFGGE